MNDELNQERLKKAQRAGQEMASLLEKTPRANQRELLQALTIILYDDEMWKELPDVVYMALEWALEHAEFLNNESERMEYICAVLSELKRTSQHPIQRRMTNVMGKLRLFLRLFFWRVAKCCNRSVEWLASLLFPE